MDIRLSDPLTLRRYCYGHRAMGAAGNSVASRVWKGVNTTVFSRPASVMLRRPFRLKAN